MIALRVMGRVALAVTACMTSAGAYDYDEKDPKLGAGAEAPWRAFARYDTVDEESTREIHLYTTDAKYLTPMVSFVPDHPTIPSPRDVLGYIAGAEGHLTHPDDTARYFRALDAASSRVEVRTMGTSEEGREMLMVLVSSEANLARVDDYKSVSRRLADPRTISEAEALTLIDGAKPFMHVTAGLHSPETGPPEMVMELAYRLAVSNHPDIVEMRDNVVLLLTPVTDVDGRARVVEWYNRYLQDYDNEHYMPSVSPPYWGRYSFHDNNRDGLQMTQKLTQDYVAAFYEWHPVYSLDLHESVPLMYVSGGTGPYNTTVDPIAVREWQLAAHWELAELQKHNLPGVWTWGFYDGWNPGYLLWVTVNHNSMGRFYETFGNLSARTMTRDLREATYAGKKVTSTQWYRADPPDESVVWSLRNNTNYMQSGVLSTLTFAARNGEMLLHNFWKKGMNSIERGKNDAPHAWVIPAVQRDKFRLAHLLNQLDRHGIEIHRATADFKTKEGDFKAGDYVVKLDQPYGNHARDLLEAQKFPEDAEHRPYDDVSWTFGYFYRTGTKPIADKAIFDVQGLERAAFPVALPGTFGTNDGVAAFAIKHEGGSAMITARYRLKKFAVHAANAAFEANGESYPAGSWIIPNRDGVARALESVAKDCMLDVRSLAAMPDVAKHALDLPRIALYHNWVSTQNDGWVRYTLEQFEVPYDYINDDDLKDGGLRGKYDVILMAHQGQLEAKTMIHGRDTKFGPMAYQKTKETPSHGEIDSSRDITGGMGFRGLANIEDFLDGGGTLLLMGSAGVLATDTGLLRNVSSVRGSDIDTPGSTLQAQVVRRDHPIAYGYEDENYLFRVNGPTYSVPEEFDHWIVVKYGTKPLREKKKTDAEDGGKDENPAEATADTEKKVDAKEETKKDEKQKDEAKFLLSGFVKGKDVLEKCGAVIDVPRTNGGRVILYSFNPMHRHLNLGDNNYVFNSLLNWNDFPDPTPKDHPVLVKD